MRISNPDYRRQVLIENAAQINETNVRAYAERCAEADPGFFRFLFEGSGEWSDFELPTEAADAYQEFLQTLPTK